uniref:Uncharacterized protein n=1 Tax=Cannabis sativa TaxID=3483 RepID=A0A803NMM3_CANSA
MVQSMRIDNNAKNLDVSKGEINLSHTKPIGYNNFSKPIFNGSQNPFTSHRGGPSHFDGSGNMYGGPSSQTMSRGGPPYVRGGSTGLGGPPGNSCGTNNSSGQRIQCQLCHMVGHTVK